MGIGFALMDRAPERVLRLLQAVCAGHRKT